MSAEVHPLDEYNAELVRNAHPSDWRNPTAATRYDLIAIGGGTAGIISALFAAGLDGKTALIERHLLGGDCLNYGCVPSKALLRAARAAYEVQHADRFGLQVGAVEVDFENVMQRMRRLRAQISHHDSAARFAGMGVDVFLGEARFAGRDTLQVDGQTLRFRRCVIATGARATRPAIPGFDDVEYLTNETLFSLTELPRRMIVVGGGPIGCEMAQAFRRFGSEVHLIGRPPRLLSRDDPAAAEVIERQFEREGIQLHLRANVVRAERAGDAKRVIIEIDGTEKSIDADEILVAIGRTANVDSLNLEAAGVKHTTRGVTVDDRLATTNRNIFAAGDIAGSYQFTHAADAMARMCVQNAFFDFVVNRQRLSKLVVPHTTYTDPEVAHVGLTPERAAEQGIEIDSYREPLSSNDRAVLEADDEGFAVVHCQRGTSRIVGATIVAAHAGDLIGEMSLMMTKQIPLGALGGTIHCYPTTAEVLKRIGDQYNKTRLTPFVAGLLKRIMKWRR